MMRLSPAPTTRHGRNSSALLANHDPGVCFALMSPPHQPRALDEGAVGVVDVAEAVEIALGDELLPGVAAPSFATRGLAGENSEPSQRDAEVQGDLLIGH